MDHGLILSGEPGKLAARVQIASVQTIVRRLHQPEIAALCARTRLVVPDEAHLSTAETWAKTLAAFPNARILGCTATPWRLSGKPLAGAYDACVVAATPAELRGQGYLSDYAGFSYKSPDLSNVATLGGDYNDAQSAEAMREPSIVANIVEKWLEFASDLSTVVFAVTVEHSKALAAEFRTAGVQAEHLDGSTPHHVRAAILRRVDQGQTRVLCNVGVAIEGLDIPRLKCCVLARPTKSLARYLQMVGRVRRPWQGVKARIHDHAFLIALHGLPDAERDYRLDATDDRPPSHKRCPKCSANYFGARCPECEHEEAEPTAQRELVTVPDAEAFEFDSDAAIALTTEAEQTKPPVDIRWDSPGRQVEGVYQGSASEPSTYGDRLIHGVRGAKRMYRLPGTAHLNALLLRVPVDARVRVTYDGEQIVGAGRWKKKFTVEIDDGA